MSIDRYFTGHATVAGRKLLDAFGVNAAYVAGGVITTLKCWYNADVRLQISGYEGQTELVAKTIEIIAEDIGDMDKNGTFVIDGVEYSVLEKIVDNGERLVFKVR